MINSQHSLAEEMDLPAEAQMLNEAWEKGEAVNCARAGCGKLVLIREGVYVDDYDEETMVHTQCFNAAKLDAACGNGPHPDEDHRLTKSEMGL